MPFIYKPIKQFMQPNESTIDPQLKNNFSLTIGGQICSAYRFQIFDIQNNLISSASTSKTPTTVSYDIISVNILSDTLTISSNDLYNGEEVRFYTDGTLPSPLDDETIYYVGNVGHGIFSVYTTKQDALDNTDKVDLVNSGDGNHGIKVPTPLYNGDILNITLDSGLLTAGNTYKWQVELFANDLSVTSVSIENNTLTVPNHNLVTGDMVYVSATTFPSPLQAYKTYYVRKIDSNTISLFEYIEGARNDAGRVDITTVGSGVIISNVAISEQIVFLAYGLPTVVFNSQTITQQSFKFKPIYTHPQGVMISNFIAYIQPSNNPDSITDSGLQENVKLEYTFDGLISGISYNVKFVINTKVNQRYETDWVQFDVDYDTPNLGLKPSIKNDEYNSSITIRWSGIKQIIGTTVGDTEFVNNFAVVGNKALKMDADSFLVYSGLDVGNGSSPPMFWWNPISSDFTGKIMRCENSETGDYIEVGYNGVNFYRKINDIVFDNAPTILHPEFLYMIGLTPDSLIVNVIGNVNK